MNNRDLKANLPATTCMTAYSYLLSAYYETNLKEPKLLGVLLRRMMPGKTQAYACWLGWLGHYAVGAGWALLTGWLLRRRILKTGLRAALIMGVASGVVSMLAWHTVLHLHRRPPHVKRSLFYRQLIPAHIVYMISFMACYQYLQEKHLQMKQAGAHTPAG